MELTPILPLVGFGTAVTPDVTGPDRSSVRGPGVAPVTAGVLGVHEDGVRPVGEERQGAGRDARGDAAVTAILLSVMEGRPRRRRRRR